jgi:formylglycine-generating enzyme required for sulfatase activity
MGMVSRLLLYCVFLVMCLAPLAHASSDSRGIKITAETQSGQSLELYSNSYALLIGVSDYSAGWPDLPKIPRELDAVEAVLQEQGFQITRVRDPDHRQLVDAFQQFIDRYGFEHNNRLLVYFSGHGYTRQDGEKGYLVPADAPNPLRDEVGFLHRALEMNQILAWARRIEAKHALFLFDSCFSGTVFKAKSLPAQPPHITTLTARDVRQFITAGSEGEEVPAESTFTPVFVDALRYGKGDLNQDGYVTGTELGLYLQAEVPKYVHQSPQFGRIRDYNLSQGDFVFVLPRPVSVPPFPSPLPPPPVSTKQVGYLQVNVNVPNAQVLVDGRTAGTASRGQPFNLAEGLAAGIVEVVVKAAGYESEARHVTIRAGDWSQTAFVLTPVAPHKARLVVRSNVADDTWYLDSKPMGPTSPRVHEMAPGSHVVEVKKAGHTTWREELTLVLGERRTLNAKLEPEPPPASAAQPQAIRPSQANLPERRESYEPEMVHISGGCFEMGSPEAEAGRELIERQHRVCVEGFDIGKYEVTQAQWRAVMNNNPSTFRGCDSCPVEMVSWIKVSRYIEELTRRTGKHYRLPTEAEWEYAARAGTTTPFATGHCIHTDQANYDGRFDYNNCGAKTGVYRNKPLPVGSLPPNPWGLYDVHGNVWEWTCSHYTDYDGGENKCADMNDTDGRRVGRGGSWGSGPQAVRSAFRGRPGPNQRNKYLGFRLARDRF